MQHLLDDFSLFFHCRLHQLRLKFVNENKYLCSECPGRKYIHPLLNELSSLLPLEAFMFDCKERNDIISDDVYDFASDQLRHIDELLRCPVSKQLYDVPYITTCFHSFDHMSKDLIVSTGKCPICFKQLNEMGLEIDTHLERISKYWYTNRDSLLALECELFILPTLKLPKQEQTISTLNRILKPVDIKVDYLPIHPKSIKDASIRQELQKLQIPTNGSKEDRLDRYNKFARVYNLNSKSNRPLSFSNLLEDFLKDNSIKNSVLLDIKQHQKQLRHQLSKYKENKGLSK